MVHHYNIIDKPQTKTKATKAALFFEGEAGITSCFIRFLLRLYWNFLFVRRWIELVSDHNNTIVFYAVFVGLLFGVEVTFHGQQNALSYLGDKSVLMLFARLSR